MECKSLPDRWAATLSRENFLVIRNTHRLNELICGFQSKGYRIYRDRYGRTEVNTTVSPKALDYAEKIKGGLFHTDFSSVDDPPDYTILYCIRQDPRAPYFGRNQIARVRDIYDFLDSIDPQLARSTTHIKLPFKIRGPIQWRSPFYFKKSEIAARYHPAFLFREKGFVEDLFDGKPLSEYIEEAAISCCADFSLSTGDALVFSNKFCLHRRSDSAIILYKDGRIISRKISISFLCNEN